MIAQLLRLAILAGVVALGVILFVWGIALAVGLFVLFAVIWLVMRLLGKTPAIHRVHVRRSPFDAAHQESDASAKTDDQAKADGGPKPPVIELRRRDDGSYE